jgi:phosphoglycerol transferase MdoB-like AlkP superfamily enzyme
MNHLRLRGLILLLVAALLLTYLFIYQQPPTAAQLKAQPVGMEGHKPLYVGFVFLIVALSTILGLALVLFDLQNWLIRNRRMSHLRLWGFALLFVTALLWVHLSVYHPRLAPEQIKAHPMLMEMRPGVLTQLELLLAVAFPIFGIAVLLFDLQNRWTNRRLQRESPKADQHNL